MDRSRPRRSLTPADLRDEIEERALLGTLMRHQTLVASAGEEFTPDLFALDRHRQIAEAICGLRDRGIPPETLAVRAWLREHGTLEAVGMSYLFRLGDDVPLSGQAIPRTIARLATLRTARCCGYELERTRRLLVEHPEQVAAILVSHRDGVDELVQASRPDGTPATCESAPEFLARVRTRPVKPPLVEGFLPGDGITLLHAQPRVFKTWVSLELAVCVAAGHLVFSVLPVPELSPVLYVTNEDSLARVGERLGLLLAGHGLDAPPPNLFLMVQTGCWLDDSTWQQRVIETVRARGIRLVAFDPLRSLTACLDRGPAELQPFATFQRTLMRTCGCAILNAHHDTKPIAGVQDRRPHSHRASGGGIFAIADSPIHMERLHGTDTVRATPSGWKFSTDPLPLNITLTVTRTTATLTATPVTDRAEAIVDVAERILRFLAAKPGASGTDVQQGVHANRKAVFETLKALEGAGRVRGEKRGTARLWSVVSSSGSSEQFRNGGTGEQARPVPGSAPI